MVNGVQCVMMDGMILMLVQCVDNLDLDLQEQPSDQLALAKDQDQYCWTIFCVLVVNQHCSNVDILGSMLQDLAIILKMQQSSVMDYKVCTTVIYGFNYGIAQFKLYTCMQVRVCTCMFNTCKTSITGVYTHFCTQFWCVHTQIIHHMQHMRDAERWCTYRYSSCIQSMKCSCFAVDWLLYNIVL